MAACHSQAATTQRPTAAWEVPEGWRARLQDGAATCSGDPWRREAVGHLPPEQGCACPPPAALLGDSSDKLAKQSGTFPSETVGRNLAKIRFPLQGRELSSHE